MARRSAKASTGAKRKAKATADPFPELVSPEQKHFDGMEPEIIQEIEDAAGKLHDAIVIHKEAKYDADMAQIRLIEVMERNRLGTYIGRVGTVKIVRKSDSVKIERGRRAEGVVIE